MAQFSLYVPKGGLKSDSFHFIATTVLDLRYLSEMIAAIHTPTCRKRPHVVNDPKLTSVDVRF